jgi:flagellar basal-body rod modification protein FlgD
VTTPVTTTGNQSISSLVSNSATSVPAAAANQDSTLSSFNSQTFLQLLVAQLKYQDPMNPTDPSQLLSQTAQMYSVTALNEMESNQQTAEASQATIDGTSLIGKSITATATDGSAVIGQATQVNVTSSGPQIVLTEADGTTSTVSLSAVTSVSAASTPASATSGTGGSTADQT